ncbi:MAG: hypothetical protein PHI90_04335 [Clostridia bacterium]|nr:hypothetical protein [Clostridia bacterium]MDD4048041.1 hypothetical protein [Clostridia bacterium]
MYISSDTNIWIDFKTINAISLPFKLQNNYVMSNDAIQDELLSPYELKDELLCLGLIPINLDDSDLLLVYQYGSKYTQLSAYDTFAMAIAKNRNYILLTGDGNLRKVALAEGVMVRGTLWIFDELFSNGYLTKIEYLQYLKEIKKYNGRQIRLPSVEIQKRIDMLK